MAVRTEPRRVEWRRPRNAGCSGRVDAQTEDRPETKSETLRTNESRLTTSMLRYDLNAHVKRRAQQRGNWPEMYCYEYEWIRTFSTYNVDKRYRWKKSRCFRYRPLPGWCLRNIYIYFGKKRKKCRGRDGSPVS